MLRSHEKLSIQIDYHRHEKRIDYLLQCFIDEPRLRKDEDVFQYWESQKWNKPELFQLSEILFAVPMAQVSVERKFPGLKFILSPQRSNINAKVLEDVLLVRTNALFKQ